ncbi:MAG: MATE family efflux transporter [Parasporobacterium sp.]|nr:MATE family efflux transporter [Parasporobacterium sp.]
MKHNHHLNHNQESDQEPNQASGQQYGHPHDQQSGHAHGHHMNRQPNNSHIELMSSAPVSKAIIRMSIPVILGMLVQMLYNLVDTFFIGLLHDENQLAAASITTPIFMLQMAIATIVSTGASSYISRCLGRKDTEKANRTLATGVLLCVILGAIFSAGGLIAIKPLVVGLGASEAVYPYAFKYVSIMLLGSIPVMLNYAGGQLIRAEGAMMASVMGMLVGTVTNIILDPLFIFAFDMGMSGAALATVLGNLAALIYYVIYYRSGKSQLVLKLKNISREGDIWKEIFTIGVPACMNQLLLSIATIILNNLIGNDDILKAGMGISSKLFFIATYIFMGFAAGCQPLIGFNYGAKNYTRVKSIFKTGMLMTFCIGLTFLAVFWLLAPNMIGFFTPLQDVRDAGTMVLRINILCLIVLGPQMLTTTGIQALGRAKEALILSVARQGIFYIPLLFIMKQVAGIKGLIFAQPIADALTFVLGLIFLAAIFKKVLKPQE